MSEEIIDPKDRHRRLRSSRDKSVHVGVIVATRRHEHNGRPMYRMDFGIPAHQAMWGQAWFYADDLEAAE